jgi:hypothetical protein
MSYGCLNDQLSYTMRLNLLKQNKRKQCTTWDSNPRPYVAENMIHTRAPLGHLLFDVIVSQQIYLTICLIYGPEKKKEAPKILRP